jgi:hypothetical protein
VFIYEADHGAMGVDSPENWYGKHRNAEGENAQLNKQNDNDVTTNRHLITPAFK